jgi:hypothetical protein
MRQPCAEDAACGRWGDWLRMQKPHKALPPLCGTTPAFLRLFYAKFRKLRGG